MAKSELATTLMMAIEHPTNAIDPLARTITVHPDYRLLGVESDENSKRVRFICPRFVDDVDLTELNLYINYQNANKDKGIYLVEDLAVDGDNVVFSWLLSRRVTEYKGNVYYIVCAKRSDGDNVVIEWNTKVAQGKVDEGLECVHEVEELNTDIIEQILVRLDSIDSSNSNRVITWPIKKDPIIPSEPDGTLLYTVYGENGLMNSDPYLVEIQGVLYKKPAPWKPGQLWVCRSGIWYLLTSESKTNFDPSEVYEGDIIEGGDDNIVWAPAPNPDEGGGTDMDDVVLLPMGKPLHLVKRENFGSAPMYAMESFIRQNDPKFDFYVDGADGTRIRMVYNGVSVFDVEVNGNSSVGLPESFTIASINGYASVEALPADMLEAYRTFCSFINTSVSAMGDGVPIAGKAEIPTVGLLWNRTYAIRLDNGSIDIFFAENAAEGMIAQEAYTTVYVYFPQDIDATISGVDYFVGGVPKTTQGWHKWIFNRLPNGQASLGALDLEAIE